MASLAGIGGVDQLHGNPGPLRLVGDKVLQLAETPTRHHAVEMFVPGFRSFPNCPEPFHADGSAFVPLRLGNDLFGEFMVFVFDAPIFVPGEPDEHALRAPGSFALQGGANLRTPCFKLLTPLPVVQRSVGGCGGVSNAEVHTHRRPAGRLGVDIFDNDVDIPTPLLADDGSRRGAFPQKSLSLKPTEKKRHVDAAADHGERNGFVLLPVVEDPGVVVDGGWSERLGNALPFPASRHRGGNPANGPYCEICGETMHRPDVPVAGVVQLDVVRCAGLDGVGQRVVAGVGERSRRGRQLRDHHRSRLHPATDGSLAHGDNCFTNTKGCQARKGRALLPGLNAGVSAPKRIG